MAKRNLQLFPKLAYNQTDDGLSNQYLGKEGLKLVNQIIDSYRHYDGKHWLDSMGEELTPELIKRQNNLDYNPTMLTANLTAWFIDRLASFMFERSIGISCPTEQIDDSMEMLNPDYEPSDKQKRSDDKAAARERILYKIMKQNLLPEKLLKAAKDYHIGTAVCAKLHYNESRGLRIIWRPRLEFWPIYDPDDIDILQRIPFVAFVDDNTIWKQVYWMQKEEDGTESCWMEEALYDTDLKLKKQILSPTDLGLPFIPVEIFTRDGLTGETEGRSLVQILKGLNDEINKKVSDNSDSLRFGMFAIKVIMNALLPSEEEVKEAEKKGQDIRLHVAPNALWTISGDEDNNADAKLLEHEFKYKDALKEHMETLLSFMHRLADVPNISTDQIKGLGQLSGFAIKLLYGPLISTTNRSMMIWRPRLQRLFGKALYMLNKYNTSKHYDDSLIRMAELGDINFSDLDELVEVKTSMPIPENQAEMVELETKKVAIMIESLKGAMDSLGIENPEQKLAEILAEKISVREALGVIPDSPNTDDDDNNGDGDGGGDVE